MNWLWYSIGYVAVATIVGSIIAAGEVTYNKRRNRRADDNYGCDDNQSCAVFFGGLFWFVALPFIIGTFLTDQMVKEKPTPKQKCILCGIDNELTSMHCHHCGNLLKGSL